MHRKEWSLTTSVPPKSTAPKARKASTVKKPAVSKTDAITDDAVAAPAGAATDKPKKAAVKKPAVRKAVVKKVAAPKSDDATPRKTAARKKPVPVDAAEIDAVPPAADNAMLQLVLNRVDDLKAEETVTIDLRGRSALTDFMVITTGRSNRHVSSIADSVVRGLKEVGVKSIHVEGMTNADWVLIDTGEVIVHVFRPEVREFYNLERLWTQGPSSERTA